MTDDRPAGDRPQTARASTLGQHLRAARDAAGLTLRQVEERTEGRVKNGYLSQVESDRIVRPSPEVLWHLSQALGLSYADLLVRAGHRIPSEEPTIRRRAINGIPLSALQDLTQEERDELVQFMGYLRHRRRDTRDGG